MDELQPSRRLLVEVCAGSVADARVAVAAGADRLELCCATEVGGLTPTIGLLEQTLECIEIPVVVMIRPRVGGFCYGHNEFDTAIRDAEWALSLGAHGIVFGFLKPNGHIDIARCKELLQLAGRRQTIFHRAFDFCQAPFAAADQLVEMGLTRLLTSGQQSTALAGAPLIRAIVARTSGSLEVMPGGGISSENVNELIRQTGCNQVHVGAATQDWDGFPEPSASLNLSTPECQLSGAFRRVDGAQVSETVRRVGEIKA